MAQTYQMKHNPQGTIYSLLTVESDGQMTMTFHGTDREISYEANVAEDGGITTGGSLFPGLESGRWQLMDDGRCKMEEVRGLKADVIETTNCTNYTNNHAEQEVIEETTDCTFERPRQSGKRLTPRGKKITTTDNTDLTDVEPVVVETNTTFAIKREQGDTCINHAEPEVIEETTNCTNYTNNGSRPRRQRKPRKPRVEHQPSDISHQTSDIGHQTSSTMKAVGMVAAATVALFVIYETGLLIPLGLIGLATGGILK